MKTIEVSDEMYDFLMDLSREINIQDNRITANPFFVVRERVKEYGYDPDYGDDNLVFLDCVNDCSIIECTEEAMIDYLEQYYGEKEKDKTFEPFSEWDEDDLRIEMEACDCVLTGWKEFDKYHNGAFTARGIKEHLEMNSHNYSGKTDTYAISLFRNTEMQNLREFLMSLTYVGKEEGKGNGE